MKAPTKEAPSHQELNDVRIFLETNDAKIPVKTVDVLLRMLSVYSGFLQSASRAKNTLSRLREAMGITPRSERGGQKTGSSEAQATFAIENLSPEQREMLAVLETKRAEIAREKADYDKKYGPLNRE